MDPRHTASMIEREENAQWHFEQLKGALPKFSLHWWKKDFKFSVNAFIEEILKEKELMTLMQYEDKEEEEEKDCIYLHGVRCLVAGAIQEWELVQQPKHAAACTKLDRALVWQGRGYVGTVQHVIFSLQPPLQGEFEKVSPSLWLVMPKSFHKIILFAPVVDS